jgi:polyphosphate kinase
MTKAAKPHAHDPSIFINRELSWLAFNERVLEEAADKSVPLLERIKFAAIAASNLDEFFMVRVAGLRRAVDEEETAADLSGLAPGEQLQMVTERARAFVKTLTGLVGETLLPALAKIGICIVRWPELDEPRRATLGMYFRSELLPVLTPLAIDRARPFPLLSSLSLNIALLLAAAPGESEPRLAVVQVPVRLPRLVPIPEHKGVSFALLEDIIQAHLAQLFPGQEILETTVIRLARDAELELDDEGGRTHLESVERELRRRRRSDVVRMEIDGRASAGFVETLQRQLEIDADAVYAQPGPLDLRVLMQLQDVPDLEDHRDPPLQSADALAGDTRDMFSILDERDVLLFQPYDSYDPVVALLAQAAADPDVLAIKQTLYRASSGSPIVASLKAAAERNKQVTVLVEVTARFDEERNIQWARALEEAGAHVIYGVRGYKTHAKVCLIVRRGARGLRRYVHLGHGELQRADGAAVHGLCADDDEGGDCGGCERGVQRADRIFGSAAFEKAGHGADGPARPVHQAHRSRAAPRGTGPAGGDRRQDELADRRRGHRGAAGSVAGGRQDPAECPRYLRAPAWRERAE